MVPRNVYLIHATAAAICDLAKIFPAWAQTDGHGQVLGVDQKLSPFTTEQIIRPICFIRR